AFFLFDCIITLSQEVDVIWRRKWTAITWLYLLTRYSTVLDQIDLLIPGWDLVVSRVCKVGLYIDIALQLMQYLCFAWFSSLRVYALLDGKYVIAGIVFLLNLVPFATNMVSLTVSLVTRLSVIVGDVLVLAVTWRKTYLAYREARRLRIRAPVTTMLFRDGAINKLCNASCLLTVRFTGTIYFLYVFLILL
ncbi:hypothetical protein BC629DRAFT_1300472, partial [Irpex lacteus]